MGKMNLLLSVLVTPDASSSSDVLALHELHSCWHILIGVRTLLARIVEISRHRHHKTSLHAFLIFRIQIRIILPLLRASSLCQNILCCVLQMASKVHLGTALLLNIEMALICQV